MEIPFQIERLDSRLRVWKIYIISGEYISNATRDFHRLDKFGKLNNKTEFRIK